jgi:hypothetical protein
MRRILFVLASAVAVVGMTAAVALADSANWHYANASISSTTGDLTVTFKETGLGTTVTTETVTVSADGSASYQCWNNGGKHPKAGNKETVNGPVSVPGTFAVRNGQVTGTITAKALDVLGPGSFSCPSGQSLYLESVSYSNISVDGQAGSFAASPDSLSAGPNLHILIS